MNDSVREAMKVYHVAIGAGYGRDVAMVAAKRSIDRMAEKGTLTSVAGFEVWKGFKTPGQIRDEINRIDSEIRQTGTELSNIEIALHNSGTDSHDISDFMDSVWDPFIKAWSPFKADHQSFTSNLWGSTWDQAEDYRRQLGDIRTKARSLGIKFRSPDPLEPEKGGVEKAVEAVWSMVKIIIYAVVIIAGILVVRRFA